MSEPIRYSIVADYQPPWAKMNEFSAGEWVKWEDYARLKAEVERLRKAIDDADDKLKLLAEWAVVCEVESAQVNQVRDILHNAAKEGKPSV